jgi:hypothetical protein
MVIRAVFVPPAAGAALQLAPTGTPLPGAAAPSKGNSPYATPFDHTHPRITQGMNGTLGAAGEATVMFPKAFARKPLPFFSYTETADSGVVIIKVKQWLGADGNAWVSGDYAGAVIKGYRSRKLPSQTPVTGLLTAVITGINAIVTAITDFDTFAGNAVGVEYSMLAVPPTSAT